MRAVPSSRLARAPRRDAPLPRATPKSAGSHELGGHELRLEARSAARASRTRRARRDAARGADSSRANAGARLDDGAIERAAHGDRRPAPRHLPTDRAARPRSRCSPSAQQRGERWSVRRCPSVATWRQASKAAARRSARRGRREALVEASARAQDAGRRPQRRSAAPSAGEESRVGLGGGEEHVHERGDRRIGRDERSFVGRRAPVPRDGALHALVRRRVSCAERGAP